MTKFEQYADAVRSGRHEGPRLDDYYETLPPQEGREVKFVTADAPGSTGRHHLIIWGVSLLLLIATIYLLFFHPRAAFRHKAELMQEVGRAQFVNWARNIGLGLDCQGISFKNKHQVILHRCNFTTEQERELRKIKTL
jgi:type II secretory pathway component PulM